MLLETGGRSRALIGAETAETYTILPGRLDAGLVILCDHADRRFPPGYGTLGLPASQLERHIAYDIGAGGVTRRLAASLGVPAIMTHYSRLLIDCNRGSDDPTLIMRLSDGAIIPGNRHLDDAERQKRISQYYEPYHGAVTSLIDSCEATGRRPSLLSIHSFTPIWKGRPRPWHAGILWDQDLRLAGPLLEALRREDGLVVGDNEPYSGRLKGDTMWQHGTSRDLPHALIEIRQDLIGDDAGQEGWAKLLAGLLLAIDGKSGTGLAIGLTAVGIEAPSAAKA